MGVEQSGGLLTITLDSPHNRNALSRPLLGELAAGLARAADPSVRAVVLTGSGRVFCSGADLRERLGDAERSAEERTRGAGHTEGTDEPVTFSAVLSAIAGCPRPIVARVNGHVRAGGMGLVAACDLAVGPTSASFAFTEVRVGVAPAVISVPALRVMAPRILARVALTGETFDATTAAAAGLLTAAVPEHELDPWVDGVVASFLQCSPSAVAATKALLHDLRTRPWSEAIEVAEVLSAELFASDGAAEGMAAFLERRPPVWAVAP